MAQSYDSGALDEPRLRELIDVGRSLVAELDLEVIFRKVIEVASELTGARYAALGVLSEDRRELERFITHGIDEEGRRKIGNLPRGRGILGLLIERPQPLRLADVGRHPRSFGFPQGHPPMANFLGVPVRIRGNAWGNLFLTEKAGGDFDQADEQTVLVLAEWTAVAVENARLYRSVEDRREEMERAVHRLEVTTEIAQAVGGETDLERILEIVLKRGRALIEARSLLILLDEGGELVVVAVDGERDERGPGTRVPIAGSVPGGVLETGLPRRVRRLDPGLATSPAAGSGMMALLAPLIFRGKALGVLVALDPLDRAEFSDEEETLLLSFAASVATAVATAQSVAEGRTREGIAATERERGRWARELHDESLQSLASLRVLLAAARRSEAGDLDQLLSQGIEQVDRAIAEMRRLIADLRPSILDQLGLGPALEALGERTRSSGEVEVEVNFDLDFEAGRHDSRLAGEVEDAVYRLVQEALNNSVRHGKAELVRVDVSENEGDLRVRVSDLGHGFDPRVPAQGFGLIGMRERAKLAGGTLHLRSAPGKGTTVTAVIPAAHRDGA